VSLSRTAGTALTSLVLAASLLGTTACSQPAAPTITQPGAESAEDSSTLTPLERGQVRTAILADVRSAIAAWQDSDADTLGEYFASDLADQFEATWDEYAAQDEEIAHVHDVEYLDVTDLNKDGSQALVTYRYDDTSYVVDAGGQRVEDLPVLSGNEIQLTMEKSPDGERWMVVRMIASPESYR